MIVIPILQVIVCMIGGWFNDFIAKNRSILGQCPSMGAESDAH